MRSINPAIVVDRHKTFQVVILVLFLIGLTACAAHYPVNKSISSVQSVENYAVGNEGGSSRSSELLLILTFSGGGTRAAAFSYGVLEALADTEVVINGRLGRLLDEVDGISSVSGGSFTAAYYGLFGDRIFEDFETKFLKNNVQRELKKRLFSPWNWPKLSSLHYDRSDLFADYYDELLFEKKTFKDIRNRKGPVVAINATDLAMGSQFSFSGFQFAPICSDLMSFPVSRAVTASSAVPGPFTSIILKNHAGTCDYTMPEWATEALRKRRSTTRRYHIANRVDAYRNADKYRYIHLQDGGLSDNLGVRLMIDITLAEGNIWKKLEDLDLKNTSTLAIIVVNAKKKQDISFAKRDYSIPLWDTIGVSSSIPLDQYSYETMELLRGNIDDWRASISVGRCQELKEKDVALRDPETGKSRCAAFTYLIEVNFDALEDDAEREHLKSLATSFVLDPEDVDRLRAAAREILKHSEEFKKFVEDLQ
ncbi:MAG: patatin-like phospholipase family protein [Deltaproteobacteria bacterium]|nr:patatin-like phospholipase family protein [Deltaproteobacteria bacterium]